MFEVFRILAQVRPSGIGAVTAYTKPTKILPTVTGIVICNTTSGPVNFSIYICTNGTTYDQTTTIAYSQQVPANDTVIVDLQFTLDTTSGTVGVQTSSANALTFTIIGQLKENI